MPLFRTPARRHRLAAVLALVAMLAGLSLVAHGHGEAGSPAEYATSGSEGVHEAEGCAACAAQLNRRGQLTTAPTVLALPPLQRIAPVAPVQVAYASRSNGLPPERAPPHSA